MQERDCYGCFLLCGSIPERALHVIRDCSFANQESNSSLEEVISRSICWAQNCKL
ncbi:hypothetical protein V6Z11_A12G266500 [Gossypium hirsutum]